MNNVQEKSLFSHFRTGIFFVLALGFLSGCADIDLPTFLTGEPDASVTQAPSKVGRAPSFDATDWPALADVPDRPEDFTSSDDWAKVKQGLIDDKMLADEERTRLEALTP